MKKKTNNLYKRLWIFAILVIMCTSAINLATANGVVRTAEITSPELDEKVNGMVTFEAYLVDDDEDDIQWAVREGTCAAGTNTVFGNVDGHHDMLSMVYDSLTSTYYYSISTDVSGWNEGMYCFVFNPKEDGTEIDIRVTQQFYVDKTPPVITFVEPEYGSIQFGVMHLKAECSEVCDYVNFWWRADDEPFSSDSKRYHYVRDDGTVFEWDLDTLNAEKWDGTYYTMDDGIYYLYAAGKDLAGNWARSQTIMVYVINDELVYGGGHALEVLDESDKRKDWLDISFGGMLGEAGDAVLVGEWEINFHNVNVNDLDKSKFHTTEITELNFFNGGTCTAMNFKATGEFNGEPGWSIIFRAGDSSDPASYDTDTVRVELYNPSDVIVYDTYWSSEFTAESNCVGTARTGLDTGNIVIIL